MSSSTDELRATRGCSSPPASSKARRSAGCSSRCAGSASTAAVNDGREHHARERADARHGRRGQRRRLAPGEADVGRACVAEGHELGAQTPVVGLVVAPQSLRFCMAHSSYLARWRRRSVPTGQVVSLEAAADPTSAAAPGGAGRGVDQLDALRRQLVADPVGGGEVLGVPGGLTLGDEGVDARIGPALVGVGGLGLGEAEARGRGRRRRGRPTDSARLRSGSRTASHTTASAWGALRSSASADQNRRRWGSTAARVGRRRPRRARLDGLGRRGAGSAVSAASIASQLKVCCWR